MEKFYSTEYLNQLKGLHKKKSFGDRPDYSKFKKWIDKFSPTSIIDYGCGKGNLVESLQQEYSIVHGYDPAIEKFANIPNNEYDFLLSTDVLEHIEYDYIDSVLSHMGTLFTKGAYIIIATTPAKNILPDGRNAHLIQEGPDWWRDKIKQHMNVKFVYQKHKTRSRYDNNVSVPNNRYIVVLEKK
jgi:2-polyprenyl-3-methyl-5-hydroxy-6-metoxy-1,4-benzoquinol methylase